MRRFAHAITALLLLWIGGVAQPQRNVAGKIGGTQSGFPAFVRVRLWDVRPPQELKLQAATEQSKFRKCASCAENALGSMTLRAVGSRIQIAGEKATATEMRITGESQITPAGASTLKADFPIDVRAGGGRLLVTAT